jgi:hypothetical protein
LPLYVFCGQQLLCAYLRPSRIDGAKHAAAILKLLVKRFRQHWPQVRIVFRGDSGFCHQRIINFCERTDVNYIIGLARNARLQGITEFMELAVKETFERTGLKQREVGEFVCAAQSWARERRVITRLEFGDQGNNPRHVVTNLTGQAQALYGDLYCQRGEAENPILEAQVDTLRIKLLNLAAVVTRNTRRIRLYLASNWPSADVFAHAMRQLRSP